MEKIVKLYNRVQELEKQEYEIMTEVSKAVDNIADYPIEKLEELDSQLDKIVDEMKEIDKVMDAMIKKLKENK